MFVLQADKTSLALTQKEPLTSGSACVYSVQFLFSPDWDGLEITAVFRAGYTSCPVMPDRDGLCSIPWEVLTQPGLRLFLGLYGRRGSELVLPTVWADLGLILEGTSLNAPSLPPTPELWHQELDRKADCLGYTPDGELALFAHDKLLASVPDRRTDHRFLSHRDDGDQHPISAISGLAQQLERIPEPVEPLTNTELKEMLT